MAASVASTSAATSGSTQAGDSSGKSSAGTGGGRPRGRTSYSGGGPTHPAAAATVATGGTGSLAHASVGASGRRTAGASGTTRHGTSNPLEAIGRHIPLPIPVPDWSKPIILVLLLLALWFGVRSRVTARRARRLEGQRATLLRDVGAMQAALVPEIPARVGGLVVSVAYRPAEGPAAGGDFYDVFVPERGKVAIILGDVAGHGHRALTQASLMRYTLRAYLQAGLEPRAALALAGRVLADRTMEHYATVAVAVYHAGEGRLTYASAGHPPPIMHGLRTRQPVAICASPPIGWTVPTGRRQTTVSLPLGAVACFYSDGLIEARCKDDLLGEERLGEILAELGPRPDAAKLLARVRAAALATPDDMAACVIVPEMAGIAARAHVEELEADAEALDGGQARRFLEVCQVATADIEQTLMRAGDIAAVFGTALLRVELDATTATVIAAPPGSGPQTAMSDGRSRPVGQL
ncbi:MAG TPA: PP2C family protein-serine/threonine phosphatase [Solirubrobacteraceae bacterium]|nr:PP2C family protein-serine/threonine phosphatase [Solirubrobacteraceae bacterium]